MKKKKWYKRKELWGAVLTTVSTGLTMFNQHTTAYKIGIMLGVGLSP
ncbi:MAG: hypothetical protein PVH88_02200 [Ignavibacteria bacterium]|jgi:hypothetical protein